VKRFRYWLDPLCLFGCAAYAINRWGLKPHLHSRFLHGHFNDALLIPCALPLILWVQRQLGLRTHDSPPTLSEIFFHLCVWSLLFEVVGPHLLPVTGDPQDVVAYFIGGAMAWAWWQRNARRHAPV